jgi:hypothetical protein
MTMEITPCERRALPQVRANLRPLLPYGLSQVLRHPDLQQMFPSRPRSVARVVGEVELWRRIGFQYPAVFARRRPGFPDLAGLFDADDTAATGLCGVHLDVDFVLESGEDGVAVPVAVLNAAGVDDGALDDETWSSFARAWITCTATVRSARRRPLPEPMWTWEPAWQQPPIAALIPQTWILYRDGVRADCTGCPGHHPDTVLGLTDPGEDS